MTAAFSTSLFAALVALALALPATAQQAVTFPAARDYANILRRFLEDVGLG